MNLSDKSILSRYIPPIAVDEIFRLLCAYPVQLKITNPRKRIHGSYRRPRQKSDVHQITVNGDLNVYTFLITLLHEIAHMNAWINNKSSGHDDKWKNCFSQLIKQFLEMSVFPEDIKTALEQHLQNIKSSDFLDITLTKTLQKYDKNAIEVQNAIFLEDIPENIVFLHDGKQMKKQKLLRKYYLCIDIKTKHLYRCHPLLKVYLMDNGK